MDLPPVTKKIKKHVNVDEHVNALLLIISIEGEMETIGGGGAKEIKGISEQFVESTSSFFVATNDRLSVVTRSEWRKRERSM